MPDDITDTDDRDTSTLAADRPAEDFVAPELKEEIERVLGTNEDGDAPTLPSAAERQRAEEEAEELAESFDEDELEPEDVGDDSVAGTDGDGTDAESSGDEEADDTAEADQAKDGDTPTLTPVLLHAAKRAGWTDDDIARLEKFDPAAAVSTFEKLAGSYNDLTNQFSALGKVESPASEATEDRIEDDDEPAEKPTRRPQSDEGALAQEIYGDDYESLRSELGPEVMDRVIGPLLKPVTEMYAGYQKQQGEQIEREVASFFEALDDTFADHYGNNGAVTDEQSTRRSALYQMADQVRTGAAIAGVDMTVVEALDRAHLSLASDHLEQVARKRLQERVKRRSGRVTQRPTQRSGSRGRGPEQRSEEAAVEAVAQRMSELGM